MRLGELLVQKKLVSEEKIEEALRLQIGGNRRLGHLLLKMKLVTEEQLIDILSHQLDMPIIDIDKVFSSEVKSILPRHICYKYSVMPLAQGDNNTLKVAMIDPSDDEAIRAVEDYTGRVVEPVLAQGHAINSGIKTNIPLSINDVFNVYSNYAKVVSGIAMVAVLFLGYMSYNYFYTEQYGTVKLHGEATVYSNHDVMVSIDNSGKYTLLGHGAYSAGIYSVTFSSIDDLGNFVGKKKKDFSVKQQEWLDWLLNTKLAKADSQK